MGQECHCVFVWFLKLKPPTKMAGKSLKGKTKLKAHIHNLRNPECCGDIFAGGGNFQGRGIVVSLVSEFDWNDQIQVPA